MTTRRVLIYSRISVANEESVSIDRQVKAAEQFAASQGWTVVGECRDEGVSATYHRPEDRPGWQSVLTFPESYDLVLVWRIDRLARKVLDFLHADETLRERGAALATVTDHINMSTPNGRLFATLLATFAQAESDSIRARVTAAREHLIKNGRVVGGTIPYGWQKVENPEGAGYVLAHNPETIGYVRGMAARALAGASVYSITKWLDAERAPLPKASQTNRRSEVWHHTSVERLLRNPVLAGMTSYQPGRQRHEAKDPTALLRDENGLPVVDESVAILSTAEHRQLLAMLDDPKNPQRQPRAARASTSPLLAGLVTCGHCDRQMYRGTTQGRPSLTCQGCHQTVSRTQLDPHIIGRLLDERGTQHRLDWTEENTDNSAELADVESAISDASVRLTQDDADVTALVEQLTALKTTRSNLRRARPTTRRVHYTGDTVAQAWDRATDDLERRQVLAGQAEKIVIFKGKTGRYLDPNRITITWRGSDVIHVQIRNGDHTATEALWADSRPL